MATIEERAKEYEVIHIGHGKDFCVEDFILGAHSEHAELTKWHDPKEELPEKDKNVIVKYVAKDDVSSEYYTIGCVYGDNKWDCESLLVACDDFKIVGWRYIHE